MTTMNALFGCLALIAALCVGLLSGVRQAKAKDHCRGCALAQQT